MRDRGEHERESGGRRRGVLDDEEVAVARQGQLDEIVRWCQAAVGEPLLVVVEADVAAVDRRRAMLRVEDSSGSTSPSAGDS